MNETNPETPGELSPEAPGPRKPEGTVTATVPGCGTVSAAFALGLLLAILGLTVGSLLTRSRVTLLLFAEVGLLGGVLVYLAITPYSSSKALRLRRVPFPAYPLALQLGFALLLANLAASALFGPWDQGLDIDPRSLGPAERLALATAIALVAPIAEESLFRGLLQSVLERRLGPWPAILTAALPFALLHGIPGPAFVIFFWTLPVGWIAWRTDSIAPGLVVHVLNNLVGVLLLLAGIAEYGSLGGSPVSIGILLAVLAAAGLWAVQLCLRIARAAASEPVPLERSEAAWGSDGTE